MNYYAQGGQAQGLKALAQELPKYGRYGDDVVAHISSEEAGILKALGGSGTINPQTGLPEYFKIGSVFKPIQRAIGQTNPFNPGSAAGKAVGAIPGVKEAQNIGTQVFQPLEKAVVQPASRGLASFDKAVGNTIPGGWGTVAATAARFVPVIGPALSVGISALNSSGVLRKGGSFNLKGAMIGGATAYAAGKLADYAAAAGGATDAAMLPTSEVPLAGGPELLNSVPYEGAVPQPNFSPSLDAGYYDVPPTMSTSPNFDPGYMDVGPVAPSVPASAKIVPDVLQQVGGPGSPNFPSVGKQIMSGEFSDAARQIGSKISDIPSDLYQAGVNAKDAVVNYDYSKGLEQYGKNVSQTGSGIKNLLGAGDITQKEAIALASKTGINPQLAAAGTVYGVMSLADLDAQRDFLKQQQAAGNIAQAEYDAAVAEIERQADIARGTVRDNPFSTIPDRDVSIGETFYGRSGAGESLYGRGDAGTTLYAMGGSVDDESGMDEARGLGLGNLSNGFMNMGSTPAYAQGGNVSTFAKGGDARERRDYLDMMDAELRLSPSAQYVEGMGFMAPPQSVGGRVGANFDAFGGNIRAGLSGNAMMGRDRKIMARPEMMDIGYKRRVGSGDLDVGLQRAIQSMPGRSKDYAVNAKYSMEFAEGGMPPRFLSGGGDGMSDSIKASINGTQEARLADGEFVIPADVVSHLGNGSSKAGAKQLYSMMDKVRKARTGSPKQGKQINPRKFLAA
jgi:hypothetical protein